MQRPDAGSRVADAEAARRAPALGCPEREQRSGPRAAELDADALRLEGAVVEVPRRVRARATPSETVSPDRPHLPLGGAQREPAQRAPRDEHRRPRWRARGDRGRETRSGGSDEGGAHALYVRGIDVFNLYTGDWDQEWDRAGYSWRATRVGDRLGARDIGGTVYELAPGQRTFPYHFHYGVEEWLLVLDGTPVLRDPSGDRELRAGDVVAFPAGAEGAHALENRTDSAARLLILSTKGLPALSLYPDSDKVGVRPGVEDDTLNFRRGDAVDYWDGE